MPKNTHIETLIAKRLSKTISTQESAELDLLLQNEDNKKTFNDLQIIWNTQIEVDTEKALAKVNARINKNKKKNYDWIAVTASVLLIAGAFFLMNTTTIFDFSNQTTVQKTNTIQSLLLNDGSAVDLNKESTLTYPEKFTSDTREVTLEGEGFFQIHRDETKPFIVHSTLTDIKVLGTSFYIKNFDENKKVEITVITGKVKVTNNKNEKQYTVLTKGQKVIFDLLTSSFSEQQVNTNDYFWKTKALQFQNSKLTDALATINKYYENKLILSEELLNSKQLLTVSFKDKTIIQVANIISATLDISISEQGDKILLGKKG